MVDVINRIFSDFLIRFSQISARSAPNYYAQRTLTITRSVTNLKEKTGTDSVTGTRSLNIKP